MDEILIASIAGNVVTVFSVVGIYLRLSSKFDKNNREIGEVKTFIQGLKETFTAIAEAHNQRIDRLENLQNSRHSKRRKSSQR